MEFVNAPQKLNTCSRRFLYEIHAAFYANLSEEHLFTHTLLQSQSHRAPLTIGLPIDVLPYYFPDIYDPSVIGKEYIV